MLLAFIAVFVVRRSPPHTEQWFFCDFANFYSGARVWLKGGDPYQMDQVYRAWFESGHGRLLSVPDFESQHVWAGVYPPPTLAALAPVAALRAIPAHIVWLSLSLAAFVVVCMALWSIGAIKNWEQRLLVALLVFASSAGISAFDAGQLALFAGCLLITGIWAFCNSRTVVAGLLIGLAACFKIQVGIPIILYYALARRWRTASVAVGVFILMSVIGIIPLQVHGINWFSEFSNNAVQTLSVGDINDPMPGGPYRNDMVNLQSLLYGISHNPRIVAGISFGLVLGGAMWLALLVAFTPRADRSLPLLSLAIVLSVLPIYHRLYDTLVLALLMVWAMRRLNTPLRPLAITTLILLSEFLIPIDTVPMLARRLHIPASVTQTLWWQGIIVPHHAWAMSFLAAWLLYLCSVLVPRQHLAAREKAGLHASPGGGLTAWAKLSQRSKHLPS